MAPPNLQQAISKLARHYGAPKAPISTDPFELVLFENVAYLVSDERREKAFTVLRKNVGTMPHEILGASSEQLLVVTKLGGMLPEMRAKRLREMALIAMDEFDGDVTRALTLPLAKAKKALRKFPSI